MAQGFGPKAIAMGTSVPAIQTLGFTEKADLAGGGDEFFDAAQIEAEFRVGIDAERAVFEGGAQSEGHLFLDGRIEGDAFNFPAEAVFGALGELHAEAGQFRDTEAALEAIVGYALQRCRKWKEPRLKKKRPKGKGGRLK